jgi:hypothetical protein
MYEFGRASPKDRRNFAGARGVCAVCRVPKRIMSRPTLRTPKRFIETYLAVESNGER